MENVKKFLAVPLIFACLIVFLAQKGLYGLGSEALYIFLGASGVGWIAVLVYYIRAIVRVTWPTRITVSLLAAVLPIMLLYLFNVDYIEMWATEPIEMAVMSLLLVAPIATAIRWVFFD